ncbi:MAG TPA: hypothetical protein VGY30_08370 [Solirubrobacteraceae bacterium]|nr:hypothetical protein [Solirubrobacteraceae bacterium]
MLVTGCGATEHPPPLSEAALVEAQTFPYFRIYWVGPRFEGQPLAAVDGTKSYSTTIGDSVYYGDCVTNKGVLGGGGSCRLPLQVTTVIYRRHSNAPLGPQSNVLIRGVPGVVYDEGRSIELYTGRTSIDIFSAAPAGAQRAAWALRTLNAPSSTSADLPPPVFCPGLWGAASYQIQNVLHRLPGSPCQKAEAALEAAERLTEKPRNRIPPLGSVGPTGPTGPTGASGASHTTGHGGPGANRRPRGPARPARRSPHAG